RRVQRVPHQNAEDETQSGQTLFRSVYADCCFEGSYMYIQEIHIENFRHLENVHLGPFILPSNSSDIVVLAGPNGGGKSSILELLGYALSSSWSLGWQLSRSFPTNSFEVALAVTPEERDLIRAHIEPTHHGAYSEAARKYFDNNSTYYRSYNYSGGKYQEN